MTGPEIPQFGKMLPGSRVVARPSAYGVVFSDSRPGRILLVQWRGRYFLPGGGLHPGESVRQALHRELLEETGHEPLSLVPLGDAGQYVIDAKTGRGWNKLCAFFVVRVGTRSKDPVDHDHDVAWIPADQAAPMLHEEASSWAVQRALHQTLDL